MTRQIRLVAFDLDGTLLDTKGDLSPANAHALARVAKAGVCVTIATGRMYPSALPVAKAASVNVPFLCYNGAVVREIDSETPLYHAPIDLPLALEVLGLCRQKGWYVQSYQKDELLVFDDADPKARFYESISRIKARSVKEALYVPQWPPEKLLIVADDSEQAKAYCDFLSDRFGKRLYIAKSKGRFIEMVNPIADKGRTLAWLAARLGIDMRDVLAMGDSFNDMEMLRAAGVALTPGDACREVREIAMEVGPPHDEDAVAWALEKYVL